MQFKLSPSRIPLVWDHWINTPIDDWDAFDSTMVTGGRIVGHMNRTVVNTLFVDGRVDGLKRGVRRDLLYYDDLTRPGWY